MCTFRDLMRYDGFMANLLSKQCFANACVTVSIVCPGTRQTTRILIAMLAVIANKPRYRIALQAMLLCVCGLLASAAAAQPFGFSVNSDSRTAGESEIDNLYLIDLATGDASRIGPVGFLDVEGLAFSPDGTLFGADDESNSLIQINTDTGAAVAVGGQANNLQLDPTQFFDFGLTFRCSDDQPILSSDNLQQLLMSDLNDNARAVVIGNTSNVPITGLATLVSDDGTEQIYGLGSGTSPNLYTVDSSTGETTLVGPLQNAAAYSDAGVAFDEDGQLWAITDRSSISSESLPSQILRIDIETGTATVVAETIDGIESLAITAPNCNGDNGTQEPTVDVPAMGQIGLAVLALVLLLLAGYHLRKPQ